ncbi:MAG: hypothetical protein DCC43_04015 [Candidatus Brocadia sp.]|nr:MAG: hypothetical protein DCC43_04015 [Candidatus Brocadia sp.]
MPLKENTLANHRDFLKDAFTMALGLSFTNISLLYSTGSQFVIYSSSTRTNRVCPCHLIINLKFTLFVYISRQAVTSAFHQKTKLFLLFVHHDRIREFFLIIHKDFW